MAETELIQMDAARIANCKLRYQEHPFRLVQIENFLNNSIACHASRFLDFRAVFGPIYGLHKPSSHVVDEDQWAKAEEENRFFHYEMLAGIGDGRPDKDTLTFLKLRQFLSSETFCALVRQMVGDRITSVTPARVHRLHSEHYLRPHHDRSGTRRIAYILYLSPDWAEQFGGQLAVIGRDGAKKLVEPSYNSLVLFDVDRHKEHFIEALTPLSKGRTRNTMSGWFLNDAKN